MLPTIYIPYNASNRQTAIGLAALIADFAEAGGYKGHPLILSRQYNADAPSVETIKHLSQTFDFQLVIGLNRQHGLDCAAGEVVEALSHTTSGEIVLVTSDVVPSRPTWLKEVATEWRKAKKEGYYALVADTARNPGVYSSTIIKHTASYAQSYPGFSWLDSVKKSSLGPKIKSSDVAFCGVFGESNAPLLATYGTMWELAEVRRRNGLQHEEYPKPRISKLGKKKDLVIAMQYWQGDQAKIGELACMMADFEKNFREDVDILFSGRWDTNPMPQAVIDKVSQKFTVYESIDASGRRGTGWPAGCNELWHASMDWAYYTKLHEGVLTFEGDVVPTAPDWLDRILAAWRSRPEGCLCVGNIIDCREIAKHVNGVSIFHRDICVKLNMRTTPGNEGWDYFHRHKIVPVSVDTPEIYMDYAKPTITETELFTPRKGLSKAPAIFHGVKDRTAIDIVKNYWKLP